jgi:hypothetical protein
MWTEAEKLKAAEEIATLRHGNETNPVWRNAHVQSTLRGFDCSQEPNMTVHVSTALELICQRNTLRDALENFIDDEECDFDHHGYCQTHGPGPIACHMALAREVLEKCK